MESSFPQYEWGRDLFSLHLKIDITVFVLKYELEGLGDNLISFQSDRNRSDHLIYELRPLTNGQI